MCGLSLAAVSGATLGCGVRASHMAGSPVGHGGLCCGAQQAPLWGAGSIVVAHGLSGSTPRGIFPDQGSNLGLLLWQADSLPLSHQPFDLL